MMTAEEFGKKIKSKYPQYSDMSDFEVGSKMYEKYPQYKDVVSNPKQGSITSAVESTGAYDIPVLGGILRGATQPAFKGVETVAEGVVSPLIDLATEGQITNKRRFMGEESFKKIQGGDIGEAAKTAVGSAAYAIPGAGIGGTSMKGLAAAGAASGYAESEQGNELQDTVLGGLLGPVIAKAPGAVKNQVFGRAGRAVTEKLPARLRKTMELTEKKLSALEKGKMSDLVGYKHIDTAKGLGITVDDTPEDVVTTITPIMNDVGKKLDEALSQEYAGTTLSAIREAFNKAQRQVTPGLKDINLQDFANRTDSFLRQTIQEVVPDIAALGPEAMDNAPLPLSIVNKVKMRVGDRYDEDPLYKQTYQNLQTLIEDQSGQPELVKALNQEYNTLREIKKQAQKQIDGGPSSRILNYESAKQQTEQSPFNDPTLALLASAAAMGGTVTSAVGLPGAGAAPFAPFMVYRLLTNAARDPETARKLIGALEKPGQLAKSIQESKGGKGAKAIKDALAKVYEQAGVRAPDDVVDTIFGKSE